MPRSYKHQPAYIINLRQECDPENMLQLGLKCKKRTYIFVNGHVVSAKIEKFEGCTLYKNSKLRWDWITYACI